MTATYRAPDLRSEIGDPSATEDAPDEPRRLTARSSDDLFASIGTLIGSFALTWILYFEVLPLSGVVGFAVSWFAVFVAMYAGVSSLAHPGTAVLDRVMAAIVTAGAAIVGLALLSVVTYTIYRGHKALFHSNFFTRSATQGVSAPYNQGGIWNCIVGSAEQVGLALLMAVPLGLGTAVFMTEVGGWFARVVRTVVEAMTAVPDLLAGLMVYVFLILSLGFQREGFLVSVALAVTMTPIIARSAEVALQVVPGGLREASLALGATQWSTVRRVVLPTAAPGLATALVLSVARGIGESAPLLIVSGASDYFTANPFDGKPQNALPLYIYTYIRSGQNALITRAFAAATVLLAVVLVLFAVARFLSRQKASR